MAIRKKNSDLFIFKRQCIYRSWKGWSVLNLVCEGRKQVNCLIGTYWFFLSVKEIVRVRRNLGNRALKKRPLISRQNKNELLPPCWTICLLECIFSKCLLMRPGFCGLLLHSGQWYLLLVLVQKCSQEGSVHL